MDGLDWADGAEVNNSGLWELNPQESSMLSAISGGFAIINGAKLGIPQDIFHSIQLLQKNSAKAGSQMFQQHPAFDQAISSSGWNQISQGQDDADRDTVLPEKISGPGICSSQVLTQLKKNEFMVMNQLTNGLDSDYGAMVNESSTAAAAAAGSVEAVKAGINVKTGGSMESLDCLLSVSNSNTENSGEDDSEISMIFSDYKTLWNLKSLNAVSSGESACDSSKGKDHNNHHHSHSQLINEQLDETASQTSSDRPSDPGQKSNKRNSETLFQKTQNDQNFEGCTFQLISENPPKPKKSRLEKLSNSSNTISFQQPSSTSASSGGGEPDSEAIAQMKEMIYRAAAFRPVNFGTEQMEKPKRKNVRISNDPQTVAARQRRERISERIRVLQRLVPGGSKMDTASMLDEAANYLKFLRSQVKALEAIGGQKSSSSSGNIELVNYPSIPFNHSFPGVTSQFPLHTPSFVYHHPNI